MIPPPLLSSLTAYNTLADLPSYHRLGLGLAFFFFSNLLLRSLVPLSELFDHPFIPDTHVDIYLHY